MTAHTPRADDQGFSLVEILTVVALMGVVLAAAWSGYTVVMKSSDISGAATSATHDLSTPLEQMSKVLMQNLSIERPPDPYTLIAWTDKNQDGSLEKNTFYADAHNKLVYTWQVCDSQRNPLPSPTGDVHTWVMSTQNANRATNTPLFRYYRADGSEITSDSYDSASNLASFVDIRLVVRPAGNVASASDVRRVYFRNGR